MFNFHFRDSGFCVCLRIFGLLQQDEGEARTLFVCLHCLIYAFDVFVYVYGQLICTQYKYL